MSLILDEIRGARWLVVNGGWFSTWYGGGGPKSGAGVGAEAENWG